MLVAAFLLLVGLVAGVATSAGAVATLISYPALLAVGIPPLAANITNSVAVVGTGISSALASGPELKGTGRKLAAWSVLMVGGTLAGAGLLLVTPGEIFAWVVPVLVAFAALLLLLQPRIAAWQESRAGHEPARALPVVLAAVGVYNGYFGAGGGITLMAGLMLTVERRLTHANALKNALMGIADVFAAVLFIVYGDVRWAAAVPLGLGFLAGGAIGPGIVRRLPAARLRTAIAVAGLAAAVWLFIDTATSTPA